MIFFHNRKVNRQNYPKSIFLNTSIKVETSFLQFGYNYSILLIKSGIFHSIGSNRTVVLTGASGSNRITLIASLYISNSKCTGGSIMEFPDWVHVKEKTP